MRRQPVDEAISAYYETLYSEEESARPEIDEFMEILVRGAFEKAADIDRQIAGKSEHWRLERMPAVDRNILRLAVYEMCQEGTPPPARAAASGPGGHPGGGETSKTDQDSRSLDFSML